MRIGIPSLMVARGRAIQDTSYWDTYVQVLTSDFTTSSTSLVNITGLTFSASATSKYEIEAVIAFQSSTTAGAAFSVAYSAALATGQYIMKANTSTGGALPEGNALGLQDATNFGSTANTTMTGWFSAIVVTGANAGNITIQGLKATNGTLTVYIGSVMKIRKIV